MIELTITASSHGRIVPPIDFGDVIAFDGLDLIGRQVAGKGHGEVVSKRYELAALVLKVVDQLRVLAILTSEGFLSKSVMHINYE